jgi:glycosyltransferase involved in cell wall biosynthesis
MSGVGNKLFKRLKPLGKGNTLVQKYLVIYSTSYWLNVEDIIRLKQEGFKIIYSYIDEISSEISSETTKLLEIFNNLEKIDPVLIVSSAKHLHMEMLQRFPKEKILLVSNGVEVENFNKKFENIPKDMKDIVKNNKPTIGYYGGIAPWIDYKLLNKLSILRPNYNFVYIGVDYNGFCLKELKIRDNVYYLGSKQYEKLGEYSNLFDVCMIPFKEGEIAKKTSPLKLFEYMAARKPVVVTKDLLECYGYEGVLVSKNHDDFIANVDKALKLAKDENVKNKLLEYAVQNTWKKKAQAIDNKLTELN